MRYGYRTRRTFRTAEEIAAGKAEKLAKSMTCQCCGRAIFAEKGLIAHHGYERPYEGWQTASCRGARELPFEVSQELLLEEIAWLEQRVAATKAKIAGLEVAEELSWTIQTREVEYVMGKRKAKYETLKVTAETFEETRLKIAEIQGYRPHLFKFEALREQIIRGVQVTLAQYESALAHQKARSAGWKVTHRKGGKGEPTWVAL